MTRPTRRSLPLIVCATLVASLGSCDNPSTAPAGTLHPVLSDTNSLSLSAGSAAAASSALQSITYVSLPAGSVPDASSVVITNRRTHVAIPRPMVDGGFDPVGIDALPNDVIDIDVTQANGESLHFAERVPLHSPPSIVRTIPPRKKTAVPINARIIIVFSEPIAGGTLGNVKLLRGQTAVSSSVVLESSGLSATIAPTATLDPLTEYTIVVSGVRDLDAEPLSAQYTSTFITGTAADAAASSLKVITTPVYVGMYTSLNAALPEGEILPSANISWSSSDTSVLAISGEGFALGRAVGTATVTAHYGTRVGTLAIGVSSITPDSLYVLAQPEAWDGDTIVVQARAKYETTVGLHVQTTISPAAATWTINDTTKARLLPPTPSTSVLPWMLSVESRDTGTVTLTASMLGKSTAFTLTLRHPNTTMQFVADNFAATAMNDSGQIVGVVQVAEGVWHVALYTNGKIKDIGGLPGATECWPSAINNLGHVVGGCWWRADNSASAFLWKNDVLSALPSLDGHTRSYAGDINDSGQVVGYSANGGLVRPVMWRDGAIRELQRFACCDAGALSINNNGIIVGWSRESDGYTAVMWRADASIVSLGEPGDGVDVNQAGDVVINQNDRSALWRDGKITRFDWDAWGINDDGVVWGGFIYGSAITWQDGKVFTLPAIPMSAWADVVGVNKRRIAVGNVNGRAVTWDLTKEKP